MELLTTHLLKDAREEGLVDVLAEGTLAQQDLIAGILVGAS
jgi:hypothetical protein